MKKTILLLFVFSSLIVMGKPYAPIGTCWWYETTNIINSSKNYIKFEVTDTALINGKMCSVIEHNRAQPDFEYQSTKDYIYEEDSIVYLYTSSTFSVLADFSAKVGNTWIMNCGNIPVEVQEIDSISVLGKQKKRLSLIYGNTYFTRFLGTMVEDILDPYAWFHFVYSPESVCFGEYYSGLRCYYNPDLGLYKTGTTDCEYTTVGLPGVKDGNIKLFTSDGQLVIDSKEHAISSVKLIAVNGVVISEDDKLNTKLYNKAINYDGFVVCVLSLENGEQYVEKVLIKK